MPVARIAECQVCLEESPIRPLSCCSSTICSTCIHSHLSTNITEAQIRISCPSCPHIFSREEILALLSEKDLNGEIAERYKRFYADIKLFEGVRWKKRVPRRVNCNECNFEWCFYCHSPWHEKMSCKEYREGAKLLRTWAAQTSDNQQNAQQCPRCKVRRSFFLI
jgi:E3 ubiquitin-protein ligase RNF217